MLPLLQGAIVIIAVIGIVVVAAPSKSGIASIAWQDGPTGGVGVATTTTQTAVANPVSSSSSSGDDSGRRRFRSTHNNDVIDSDTDNISIFNMVLLKSCGIRMKKVVKAPRWLWLWFWFWL